MSSRKDRRSAYIVTGPDEFEASFAAGSRSESPADSSTKSPSDSGQPVANSKPATNDASVVQAEKPARQTDARPRSARDAARAARKAIDRGAGKTDAFSDSRTAGRASSESDSQASNGHSGRAAEMGRLSVVGAIVLAGLVVAAPWFFGSVTPLYIFVLLIGFAALVALWWTAVATQGGRAIRLPWNLVPLLFALLFAGFQLVPLPESWLQTLSPDQYALREELGLVPAADSTWDETATEGSEESSGSALDGPGAADAESESEFLGPIYSSRDGLPISLDPKGTRQYLALLLLATTAFACSVVFLRRRRWFLGFATVVAINGFLLSAFGIVQYFTSDGKLYWTYEVFRSIPFASYVNGNNAGGYLNLCLACLIGVALNAFRSSVHNRTMAMVGKGSSWSGGSDDPNDSKSFGQAFLSWFADLTVWKLFLLLMIATVMTGLFLTLSRGAIIANLIALALTACVLMFSERNRAAGGWLIAVVVLGGALTYGLNEFGTVNRELSSLQEIEYENDARMRLLRDLAPHWESYLWTGAGLGSFGDVYRIHRSNTNDQWFHHADNTYLEAYFETGLIGTSLLLICILWTLWQAIYLVRHGETTADNAIGVVGAFAVFSQFAQAFSDYGLYVPANMILMAAICGGTAIHAHRIAEARKIARTGKRTVRLAIPVAIAWIIPLALFGAMIWLVRPVQRDVELNLAMVQARALLDVEDKRELDPNDLEQAIEKLESLVELTPDGDAYRRLGDLYAVRYRLAMKPRLLDRAERLNFTLHEKLAYQMSSLAAFNLRCMEAKAESQEEFAKVVSDPIVVRFLKPALLAYEESRKLAPFQALTYLRIAELSPLLRDETVEGRALEIGLRLSPGRAELHARAGTLEANRGNEEKALEYWKQSLSLSEQFREQILNDAATLFSSGDILSNLLPSEPRSMIDLLRRFSAGRRSLRDYNPSLVIEIQRRAIEFFEPIIAADPSQLTLDDYLVLRQTYEDLERPEEARQVLETAIAVYPKRIEHRMALARMLKAEEKYTEALELVEDCMFYASGDPELVKLKADLENEIQKQKNASAKQE